MRTNTDVAANAVGLIGRTPVVDLARVHGGPGRILAKAEFLQPGGSVKDRAARAIIEAARADGRLKPGAPVVEMTSGNMGAGLAVVCAALGHPLVVTLSAGNSAQRARMLEGLGAEVILVPQVDGAPGHVTGADIAAAARVAERLAAERGGFYVDQFNAPEGKAAHALGTARELLEAAGGRIDGWTACVGTGCTFLGVARGLKDSDADVLCAAVEPAGCQVLAGKTIAKSRHVLQGAGYGTIPPMWEPALMSLSIAVSDDEAVSWKRRLAIEEGLYVGFTAAANVCAAAKLLASGSLAADATVATVLCDTGLKY
ncbi:MAG: pyridoxal-phosphate dependent enzyme [Hyphomicrobiales bacterium]|nr:MAG: pyridoxal-phosphate dependent enzyme [Hyphomicrobiales bacterium]